MFNYRTEIVHCVFVCSIWPLRNWNCLTQADARWIAYGTMRRAILKCAQKLTGNHFRLPHEAWPVGMKITRFPGNRVRVYGLASESLWYDLVPMRFFFTYIWNSFGLNFVLSHLYFVLIFPMRHKSAYCGNLFYFILLYSILFLCLSRRSI